jgi:hypothetical protein
MNNEQAKFILRAYRPGGRDTGDATFCEALRQAQLDPGLGAWLAREQAFDSAVAAKLRSVPPPPGLREAILAGAHLSTPAARPWWRPAGWLAMAASLVVLLSLVAVRWHAAGGPAPASLEQMARFALADPESAHTGPHADKLGTFGAWLQSPANRISTLASVDLAKLQAQDCRAVSVAGHEVFEICFQRDGGWYHLYIARRRDFDAGGIAGAPLMLAAGGRSVAAWAGGKLAYVLMTGGGEDVLRRIL